MQTIDKIALSVLSFLLALFMFGTTTCFVIKATLCNPNYLINTLDDKGYYSLIHKEYSESIEDGLAVLYGVDEGLLSGVMSEEDMKSDIQSFILAAYSSESNGISALDTTAIRQKFNDTLVNFFIGKGYELDEESYTNIMLIADECAQEYNGYCGKRYVSVLGDLGVGYSDKFFVIAVVTGCISIFLIVLLFLTKKWRSGALFGVGVSSLTVGISLVALPLYVLLSNTVKYLNIETKSLYQFAVGYVTNLLYMFIALGCVFVASALVIAFFAVIYPFIKNKRKYKNISSVEI